MTPFTILVVQHEQSAGPALIGERIVARGGAIDLRGPDVVAGARPVPDAVGDADGLLVLGGWPGPTDDDRAPWLAETRALIADALARNVPLLGICLGSQLLATVAGGTVAPIAAAAGPEIGLAAIELTAAGRQDPLLGDLGAELEAIQWHSLAVSDPAPGAVTLAANDHCPVQAFRVGAQAWGMQFHFEAGTREFTGWLAEGADELVAHGRDGDAELGRIVAAEPRLHELWSIVADRWIDLCTAVAQVRAPAPSA